MKLTNLYALVYPLHDTLEGWFSPNISHYFFIDQQERKGRGHFLFSLKLNPFPLVDK
jgi:hypothetical protein